MCHFSFFTSFTQSDIYAWEWRKKYIPPISSTTRCYFVVVVEHKGICAILLFILQSVDGVSWQTSFSAVVGSVKLMKLPSWLRDKLNCNCFHSSSWEANNVKKFLSLIAIAMKWHLFGKTNSCLFKIHYFNFYWYHLALSFYDLSNLL